jgi:nifR3 family TIM-barrel protein
VTLRIGQVQLETNLLLSPLAGYTNLPFRLTIREIGGVGLCTTDLVNARSLIERNAKARKLIETCPADHPLAVQLYGSKPDEMCEAARLVESAGADVVDINMGCPVRKVCRTGSGSALMNDAKQTADLVRRVVAAVRIPVTCKMRLGWDEQNLTAPDLARALEDAGAAAIIVHGRTRQQGFTGPVNLAGIRAVVAAVKTIPVVGNGDITTPAAAKTMFDETGCAAISIGRGAFYNPWIFRHIRHYLATGETPPEPTITERLAVMSRHLDRMVAVFGEEIGCRMFRKVALEYARQFGPVAEFKRRVVRLRSRAEFADICAAYQQWRAQFLDEAGQLRPAFAPRPLAAVSTIPVPRGPNELW